MIRGLGDSVRYVPTILTWRNMCVIFLSGSRQLKRSRPNGSKYKRWIIAYSYDSAYAENPEKKYHAIVYRDAEELNGVWSPLKTLLTAKTYPGLYSPYFHPLKNKGDKLYFTMSLWKPYNVYLMSADIEWN